MSLLKYQKKRDLNISGEPAAIIKNPATSPVFVVHRHLAGRLHYDFRIEASGVLKSWVVPKGPSMNPADKRLAIMVEDHPLDYQYFKGVIPEGYGAGIVEIWDKGSCMAKEESAESQNTLLMKGLKSGQLDFFLKGKKLKGAFSLIRTSSMGKDAWLLIKQKDDFGVKGKYDIEKEVSASSPINKWLKKNMIPLSKASYHKSAKKS